LDLLKGREVEKETLQERSLMHTEPSVVRLNLSNSMNSFNLDAYVSHLEQESKSGGSFESA